MLTTVSGQKLSKLCFGTMQFGSTSDYQQSKAVFSQCRRFGINHFDTAHAYTEGASEKWLGEFVQKERDNILISSKVGYTGGAGPKNLTAQLDLSLRRLGQDWIDILYLHRFDPDTPLEKTLNWFAQQAEKKRVRYIGVSNFAAWQIIKAQFIGRQLGIQISAVQPMYSLVKRQAEVEILPACNDFDISCFSYSPLAAGLLTGKYISKKNTGRLTEDARYRKRYGAPEMFACATALSEIGRLYNLSPAMLAVAWILKSPHRTTPIVSGRTTDQLVPVLGALDFEMSDELMTAINDISPKPAPATDRLEEQE